MMTHLFERGVSYMRGPPESPEHGSWYSPFLNSTFVPNIFEWLNFVLETVRSTRLSRWLIQRVQSFFLLSVYGLKIRIWEYFENATIPSSPSPACCHHSLAPVLCALNLNIVIDAKDREQQAPEVEGRLVWFSLRRRPSPELSQMWKLKFMATFYWRYFTLSQNGFTASQLASNCS